LDPDAQPATATATDAVPSFSRDDITSIASSIASMIVAEEDVG
jgi:hypothetical protein